MASLACVISLVAGVAAMPSGSCTGDGVLPLPFTPAGVRAFSQHTLERTTPAAAMSLAFARRREAFCAASQNQTAVQLVAQAVRAGLVVGTLGVDLGTWAQAALGGGPPALASLEASQGWKAVRALYFAQTSWHGIASAADYRIEIPVFAYPQRMLHADLPARYRSAPHRLEGASRALFLSLSRDGFAKVARWEGLDIGAVARVANGALDEQEAYRKRKSGTGRAPPVMLAQPAQLETLLAPLFASRSLRVAVDAYLGTDADSHACSYGYTALRLRNGTSPANYVSSLWHHDRVGRRLKLFVFLHNVDGREGRPTVVARGTHNQIYYSSSGMLDSRFDDTWVEAHHEAVPMDGPRGGGFLLDTNALHVGRWQGRDARSVVVIELDRQGRSFLSFFHTV